MAIKIPVASILMADGVTTFRDHVMACNQVSWPTALHRYCNLKWPAQDAAEAPKGSRQMEKVKPAERFSSTLTKGEIT